MSDGARGCRAGHPRGVWAERWNGVQHPMHVCSAASVMPDSDPMDCSPPGSSVRGILQARIMEWVAMPSSGDLPDSGVETESSASPYCSYILYHWATRETFISQSSANQPCDLGLENYKLSSLQRDKMRRLNLCFPQSNNI